MSNFDSGGGKKTINNLAALRVASNKLSTFQALKDKDGIRIPEYTTDLAEATGWITEKHTVVCRTVLGGHSGAGIVLAGVSTELVRAPLYVKYVKKQQEFRVHVAFGGVIDVQEKRQRKDTPEGFKTDFQVRNHHTGWVYCREDINQPEGLGDMAVRTVSALGLDFGAVDIIYNVKQQLLYVLEVNTAPGLEGTTVERYADAFWENLK
jgi:glutathione synthase/RimK-type ligase-like ATP-grasp enzyme